MSVSDSSIEWTDATWGPIRGCSRVSAGCENCYAERQANRFKGKGLPYEGLVRLSKKGPVWTGKVRLVADQLAVPLRWRKAKRVFVNSMSDCFHERLTNEEIAAIFGVMAACPQHSFQILTKRAKRMREWFEWASEQACHGHTIREVMREHAIDALPADEGRARMSLGGFDTRTWPLPNAWIGVSVEDQKRADERIPDLMRTPAAVRFISYEPALGPVDFSKWVFDRDAAIRAAVNGPSSLNREQADDAIGYPLSWIICGGESGPNARTFDVEWARAVIAQCKAAKVPCFVKQLGKVAVDSAQPVPPYEELPMRPLPLELKDTKGGTMREWPKELRVREYPKVARP